MRNTRLFAIVTLALFAISACNMPGGPAATSVDVNAIYTAAAQTLAAQQTQSVASQPTIPPSDTPVPATPTSAETPTPEFTPTATIPPFTPTPSVPIAVIETNANCRKGPSTQYDPPVAVLRAGDRAEIQGRNQDRSWWVVQIPGKPGQTCWVWGNNVNVEGDTNNVQVVTPPPVPITPTFTPTPDVEFDPSFDNVHDCGGDPFAIFEVDNNGDLAFESMRLKIVDKDQDETIFNKTSDDPFMSGSGQCPEGDDSLRVNRTAWVGGNIDTGNSGNEGTATITLCTEDDLDGICVSQEVDFDIP